MLRPAPTNGIIEAHLAKWKSVHRRKKTPRKLRDKSYKAANAALFHILDQDYVSIFNLEDEISAKATCNDRYHSNHISDINLQFIRLFNLDWQSVQSELSSTAYVRAATHSNCQLQFCCSE